MNKYDHEIKKLKPHETKFQTQRTHMSMSTLLVDLHFENNFHLISLILPRVFFCFWCWQQWHAAKHQLVTKWQVQPPAPPYHTLSPCLPGHVSDQSSRIMGVIDLQRCNHFSHLKVWWCFGQIPVRIRMAHLVFFYLWSWANTQTMNIESHNSWIAAHSFASKTLIDGN